MLGLTGWHLSLVPFIAHPKKAPLFMRLIGGTMGIGYATGPLIGGAFNENVTWRWNMSYIDYCPLWELNLLRNLG